MSDVAIASSAPSGSSTSVSSAGSSSASSAPPPKPGTKLSAQPDMVAPKTAPKPPASTEKAAEPPTDATAENEEPGTEKQPGETAAQHEKRLHKLKIDDQEVEVDDEELKRGYTHARSANERMRQAAEERKQTKEFMTAFAEDPVGVLDELVTGGMLDGEEVLKAMEMRLLQKYKRDIMTPEQIEQEKKDKDAQAWREHNANLAKKKDEDAISDKAKVIQKDLDTRLTQALETIDLIRDPDIVKDAAEYMKIAISKGYDLDVPHIAAMVKEKYANIAKKLIGGMNGDQAIKFLGEELANKIRKADLARLRTIVPKADTEKRESAPRERSNDKVRLRPNEFLAAARKRAGI